MQQLPDLTLDQACDLAMRYKTIETGLVDFLARGATVESLLDHACHAAKAAIVLFQHAHDTETHLFALTNTHDQAVDLLERMQQACLAASNDPEHGPIVKATIAKYLTVSDQK